MKKIYISANAYLQDSFRLARMILDSGWRPDELIALWRGGAPVGVSVHEFFYYHGLRPRHHVLKCQSYTGIQTRQPDVTFENAESIFSSIPKRARVLIVDDVFDTGNTARAVLAKLNATACETRIATVYWKPQKNQTTNKPDYVLHQTDEWIVFPHELDGLTPEEIKVKDPVIYHLLLPQAKTSIHI